MAQQDLNREVSVVTPEQVRLSFQTAGVGSRAGAQAIDIGISTLFFLLLFSIIGELAFRTKGLGYFFEDVSEVMAAVAIVIVLVVQFGYYVICETTMGRTVGGRIVGLRVIQDNGRPVTVLSSLIRNFFRIIDLLPMFYLLGAAICFFHPKDKRLGDILAGTVVIYDSTNERIRTKKKVTKDLSRYIGSLPSIPLEEHHRRACSREDWSLLSAYVERFSRLTEPKRSEIAAEVARYLIERLQLPYETLNGTSPVGFLLALYEELRADWEL